MQGSNGKHYRRNGKPESKPFPNWSGDSEQTVLSALLNNQEGIDDRIRDLQPSVFYLDDNRLIFGVIRQMQTAGMAVAPATVIASLDRMGQLDKVGGPEYIVNIAANSKSSPAVTQQCLDNIVQCAQARDLADFSDRLKGYSVDGLNSSPMDAVLFAEREIHKLSDKFSNGKTDTRFTDVNAVMSVAIEEMERRAQSESKIIGTPTGMVNFDNQTSGLISGDLIVVAGSTGIGKTTFALNIVESACDKAAADGRTLHAVIFSLEMPKIHLINKMLASLGRVKLQSIRTGKLEDDEWARLTSAIGRMQDFSLKIDDSGHLTPSDMAARCRRLDADLRKATGAGLGLVMVDYIQLMTVDGYQGKDSRRQEIEVITRELKLFAKDMSVPVIALSQLNRNMEHRKDKRPVLGDLRESGSIAQDADMVIFPYRDEMYHPDSVDAGYAEIIWGKNRMGPTGEIIMQFEGAYSAFRDSSFHESFALPSSRMPQSKKDDASYARRYKNKGAF